MKENRKKCTHFQTRTEIRRIMTRRTMELTTITATEGRAGSPRYSVEPITWNTSRKQSIQYFYEAALSWWQLEKWNSKRVYQADVTEHVSIGQLAAISPFYICVCGGAEDKYFHWHQNGRPLCLMLRPAVGRQVNLGAAGQGESALTLVKALSIIPRLYICSPQWVIVCEVTFITWTLFVLTCETLITPRAALFSCSESRADFCGVIRLRPEWIQLQTNRFE